ncbi:MAG: hypothetical protein QOI89_1804 [Solirubrobacteraceae bacterium]|nr:hypothetical protein [Solirubrobacteraceae bacterium]
MSADAEGPAGERGAAPGEGSGQPTEEEVRAAYEAELARITSTDMIAQAVVSLLSIGARRLGSAGAPQGGEAQAAAEAERDLEQVRDAIDAVRALLEILERRIPPQELRSLRDALSQLQVAYAREVQAAGGADQPAQGEQPGGPPPAAGQDAPGAADSSGAPGPAQSSGKLWVPGS